MSDAADRAADAEENHRADAQARQRAEGGVLSGNWKKLSAKWCTGAGCGERIPDARRQAIPGVERCVDCQERKEQQERLVR